MEMSENWKDIAGYEGLYQVSDRGRKGLYGFDSRCAHTHT